MVRETWAGLGYYRRAANLHRLARTVVREHAGVIPSDPGGPGRLPGVGRYTAGAVASFAYERATPAIDTNVARVIRRAFHPRLAPAWRRSAPPLGDGRRHHAPPAAARTAWAFNQAIMELGALICTARVARCEECPVRRVCRTGRRSTARGTDAEGREAGAVRGGRGER